MFPLTITVHPAQTGVKPPCAPRGFVQVDHAVTADPSLSDAEYRALCALDRFRHQGRIPTNRELATACGWPDPQKARRVLHALAAKGKIVLDTAGPEQGCHRRKLVAPPLKSDPPPTLILRGVPPVRFDRAQKEKREKKTTAGRPVEGPPPSRPPQDKPPTTPTTPTLPDRLAAIPADVRAALTEEVARRYPWARGKPSLTAALVVELSGEMTPSQKNLQQVVDTVATASYSLGVGTRETTTKRETRDGHRNQESQKPASGHRPVDSGREAAGDLSP